MVVLNNPFYILMVGLPGSGKSTFIYDRFINDICEINNISPGTIHIASTDNIIESFARENNTSYDEEFSRFNEAERLMIDDIKDAFSSGRNVIKDMTHVSMKSRRRALALAPDDYNLYACNVSVQDKKEHMRRLNSRKGKTIPSHVMKSMEKNFSYATMDEGFHGVFHYYT